MALNLTKRTIVFKGVTLKPMQMYVDGKAVDYNPAEKVEKPKAKRKDK